jgi:hypothetical protein
VSGNFNCAHSDILCWFTKVEAVIHFDDDTEELQQWDQQVSFAV